MSNLLEALADKITLPENKLKLTNFLGIVEDVVSSKAKVAILDTGNRFLLSQKDGIVNVTVSRDFLGNMGNFELGVHGSTPFASNVHFNMSTPLASSKKPVKNESAATVTFTKLGELYKANVGNGFLECIDNIRMVNMLKRPNLPLAGFNMVKKYLESQGFNVKIDGEEDIEDIEEDVDEEPGTVVVNTAPTSEPSLGEKIVIKEVPVYVDKIVIKEVPVEVQKIVIKEVPVYIEVEKGDQRVDVEVKSNNGPIQEPDESDADQEEIVSTSQSEHEDDQEEIMSSSNEQEEESSEEVAPASPVSSRKLKGRWINEQKTILKSGEFVYRVDKKIDGPTVLYALGRWDKDKQKRVPLRKGDAKLIKRLGNKIAKV